MSRVLEAEDPDYIDGPGPNRSAIFSVVPAKQSVGSSHATRGCIVIFTHGFFMQAFRLLYSSLMPRRGADVKLSAISFR